MLFPVEGLSSLIDRVRRLDDAQAREAITRYAANESDPRAALLALLHADSLTYGARILQEVEHVAPVCFFFFLLTLSLLLLLLLLLPRCISNTSVIM